MINITSKTLMVDIENDITLHNGAITMTVLHQAYVNQGNNGEVYVDVELADYSNVKFLGKETSYSKLKLNLKELDVDLDELVHNSVEDVVTDEDVEYLKQMYLTIKSPYTK